MVILSPIEFTIHENLDGACRLYKRGPILESYTPFLLMSQMRRPSLPSPFDSTVSSSPTLSNAGAVEADAGFYYVFVEEVMQRGAVKIASTFLSPDFVEHGTAGDRRGPEFVSRLAARRARFPNAVWTIELLVVVGGLVVCHTTMVTPEMTAQGWESVVIRFDSGKIAECWRICDESLSGAESHTPPDKPDSHSAR